MPLLQNAKKALRSSKRKAVFNSRVKSILKTMIDKMKADPSSSNLSSAFSSIDKAVKGKLMHKNKAGRMKAQLSKLAKVSNTKKNSKLTKSVVKQIAKKTNNKDAKKIVKKSSKTSTQKSSKKLVKSTSKKTSVIKK